MKRKKSEQLILQKLELIGETIAEVQLLTQKYHRKVMQLIIGSHLGNGDGGYASDKEDT